MTFKLIHGHNVANAVHFNVVTGRCFPMFFSIVEGQQNAEGWFKVIGKLFFFPFVCFETHLSIFL